MADAIAEHAPAKVNLALHITGQRADGYHLLDSLVVFTEAGDRITVEPADTDTFTISAPFGAGLDTGPDNLVIRARDRMRELTAIAVPPTPVAIHLEKNLPVASGIGGGSSDAAATLRALCRLWGILPDSEDLDAIGLKLGADVPMCVRAHTLVARGIGEEIEPARLPSLAMVLVNPGVAISTPAAFRALQRKDNPPLPPVPDDASFEEIVEWLAGWTRNDLEPPARSLAPEVGETLDALRDAGAALARMSGSGATCFGLFPSQAEAEAAAARLAAAHPAWYVRATRTI
ncbi:MULTISPECIES: 4-(cytidine 5'-diphospho)-2-C-methyl-D-erythritol kinase [unclassified Aminobacter]|uniref:4-(cytidine 5'-diphospho)-2-C-methyl-D-erythritol kinase n=1 Tax=unclassified Aminobacter TaxID=2644704 RepID=UPI0004BB8DA1|nr:MULTISPECIES: 4-(cytidine 5'-diphospho)-2-C-methyl-D-erythritol kinase [unclassified Aminobacter]TWG63094.1 4-diphosphocytidyl-2-C-methyl-D-erythritol kinase [Aminobacter sp. J44]